MMTEILEIIVNDIKEKSGKDIDAESFRAYLNRLRTDEETSDHKSNKRIY